MTKYVEYKIRDHYMSEDGEWLVEKGKVKEARLLKEATERIEKLKKALHDCETKVAKTLNINKQLIDKDYMTIEQAKNELKSEMSEPLSQMFRIWESGYKRP